MLFNGYSVTFLFVGKTLLAKAVANQTAATFLRVVGSELIQKYLVRKVINYVVYGPWMYWWLCVTYVLFQSTRVQYVSWWRETFQSNDSSLRENYHLENHHGQADLNHWLCLTLALWIVFNVLAVVRSCLQMIFTMNSRSNMCQCFHVFREMVQSWSGKCLE